MTQLIKQYGLKRSGTNITKALLEENFDCKVMAFVGGNKHAMVDRQFKSNYDSLVTNLTKQEHDDIRSQMLNGDVKLIATFKDPFAWLRSYWKVYGRGPLTMKQIPGLIKRYNDLNQNWQDECDVMVFYDDLIIDPWNTLIHISLHLQLDWTHQNGLLRDNFCYATTRAGEVTGQELFTSKKFDPTWYTEKRYMDTFTERQKEYIEKHAMKFKATYHE